MRRIGLAIVIILVGWGVGDFPSLPREHPLAPVALAQTQEGWLQQLDLTPEQLRQIQAIYRRYQEQLSSSRRETLLARRTLGDLLIQNASSEDIRQQYQRFQDLERQVTDLRFEILLEVRSILTPDQRQRMAELLRQRLDNARNSLDPLNSPAPAPARPFLQRWLQRQR